MIGEDLAENGAHAYENCRQRQKGLTPESLWAESDF